MRNSASPLFWTISPADAVQLRSHAQGRLHAGYSAQPTLCACARLGPARFAGSCGGYTLRAVVGPALRLQLVSWPRPALPVRPPWGLPSLRRFGPLASVLRRSLRSLCCLISGQAREMSNLPPLRPRPPRRGGHIRGRPCGRPAGGYAVRGEGAAARRPPAQRAAALRGDAAGEPVRPAPASASPAPARRASDTRADAAGEA